MAAELSRPKWSKPVLWLEIVTRDGEVHDCVAANDLLTISHQLHRDGMLSVYERQVGTRPRLEVFLRSDILELNVRAACGSEKEVDGWSG